MPPATRKPRAYHHGDLAAALVTAGRKVLREQGLEKLSLRKVATEVGVSQTALYTHFADKKDLLRAISASGFCELAEAMEATRDPAMHARQQVLEYGTTYVNFAIANPAIYRLMISTSDPITAAQSATRQRSDRNQLVTEAGRPYLLLRAAFDVLVSNPERADVLSIGAWSMVHGLANLVSENLVTLPEGGPREVLEGLMAVQLRKPLPKAPAP